MIVGGHGSGLPLDDQDDPDDPVDQGDVQNYPDDPIDPVDPDYQDDSDDQDDTDNTDNTVAPDHQGDGPNYPVAPAIDLGWGLYSESCFFRTYLQTNSRYGKSFSYAGSG